MAPEDGFHAVLDADPADQFTRAVLGEWLEDMEDRRAEGYRAIAAGGHAARHNPTHWPLFKPEGGVWEWWRGSVWEWWRGSVRTEGDDPPESFIPDDWFDLVASPFPYCSGPLTMSHDFATRREGEDALALAFLKLPAARRAELLGVQSRV